MNRWLLDTGVVSILAKASGGELRCGRGVVHVSEAVELESRRGDPNSPQNRLLDLTDNRGDRVFEVLPVLLDTPEFDLLSELRPSEETASVDLGEHESIALCATSHAKLIFVSLDKGALRLILSELGRGRVAYPYELCEELKNIGALEEDEFERALEGFERHTDGTVPVPARLKS